MGGYADAIERRLLVERFFTDPNNARAIGMIYRGDGRLDGIDAFAERMRTYLVDSLSKSPCYAVAPEICDLIEATAPTFPELPLRAEMLPTRRGWLLFERPLSVPQHELHLFNEQEFEEGIDDPLDAIPNISAFSWSLSERGVLLACYADIAERRPMPCLIWEVAIEYGMSWDILRAEEHIAYDTFAAILRYVFSIWEFMGQEILVATKTPVTQRATRRRLERAGKPTDVLVVALRRRRTVKAEAGQSDPVDWSCRWVVNGHWRKQFYPRTGEHRPRFIMPYEKGPADKPLRVRPIAYEVRR